jgi:hypothetical protein
MPPTMIPFFTIGNFFKNPKDRKKREEKEIWPPQGIYVYSRHNKNNGYDDCKNDVK